MTRANTRFLSFVQLDMSGLNGNLVEDLLNHPASSANFGNQEGGNDPTQPLRISTIFKLDDPPSDLLPIAPGSSASSDEAVSTDSEEGTPATIATIASGLSKRVKSGLETTSDSIQPKNMQEDVDQLMDHSIEIDSNKKIRNEHVHPWTLQFIQEDMEREVPEFVFVDPYSIARLKFSNAYSSTTYERMFSNQMFLELSSSGSSSPHRFSSSCLSIK